MTQQIIPGMPDTIRPFMWLDPLRGKVSEDLLCDGTARKINGERTWIISPTFRETASNAEFPDAFNHESSDKKAFYIWLKTLRLYSLAFSMETFDTLNELDDDTINQLALELFPHPNNKTLGVFHGRASGYVQGCRGPLCRWANTEHQRKHRGSMPADLMSYNDTLAWEKIASSHERYRWYIKAVRRWRINNYQRRDYSADALTWRAVTYTETVLMDATDEESLILGSNIP